VKLIVRNPEDIYQLDPWQFEELIAGGYKKDGYDDVIITPRSADHGIDIIATRNGWGSIRLFDQVKRSRISHPVAAKDVRALLGVVLSQPNVSKGVFTTSGIFAPDLLEDENIARQVPHVLELRPRESVIRWLKKVGGF
jgi:restriction system protein